MCDTVSCSACEPGLLPSGVSYTGRYYKCLAAFNNASFIQRHYKPLYNINLSASLNHSQAAPLSHCFLSTSLLYLSARISLSLTCKYVKLPQVRNHTRRHPGPGIQILTGPRLFSVSSVFHGTHVNVSKFKRIREVRPSFTVFHENRRYKAALCTDLQHRISRKMNIKYGR